MKKSFHLICNAHLDPVWLWEWEEGAAEAISTFRTAADLCEENDAFIFNHNEVILYEWVREYEPELFARIQKLVKKGRWHIMGGWYLQPDCNMPSGESFVRQILIGRQYFKKFFGVTPTVAINFDPFGHSRGLVQIMAKSGFKGYLFGRPTWDFLTLENDAFIWKGFDGSEIHARRFPGWYNTHLGNAQKLVESRINECTAAGDTIAPILWGVGNHGGGPSHKDLKDIQAFVDKRKDVKHSTPDAYFSELIRSKRKLPERAEDINPWAVGCYTSQVKIKQRHRQLENELYATEKMVTAAAFQNAMNYPEDELHEAQRDLAYGEFHDILPGSSIQPAEEAAVRMMDHGLEILSRIKAQAFFALAQGQNKSPEGQIPVLVYNPHPFEITTDVVCEFQLADINEKGDWTEPQVYKGRTRIPSQVIKEESNLNADWRKRVVFRATLQPSQINRFECKMNMLPEKPEAPAPTNAKNIVFKTKDLQVKINTRTGRIDSLQINGKNILTQAGSVPVVYKDDEDPWGMSGKKLGGGQKGTFTAMTQQEAATFAGIKAKKLPPVRIVEDGPVFTVVEALMKYHSSALCVHYLLPKEGTEIGVTYRVYWQEKDALMRVEFPTVYKNAQYFGQTAYGVQKLADNNDECVSQKWSAVIDRQSDTALTCINTGTYGSRFNNGKLAFTLLRGPAYSGHPMGRAIVPQNRFTPRTDQGEHLFSFWLNVGKRKERMTAIDREALARNEMPMALSFYPSGHGAKLTPFIKLNDDAIQITAMKKAETSNALIIRLFEPTGKARTTTLTLPAWKVRKKISLKPFEIKTLKITQKGKACVETDLMEKKIRK